MNLRELPRVTIPSLPGASDKDQSLVNQKFIDAIRLISVRDGDKEKRLRALEDNKGVAVNPTNLDHALLDNLNSTDINHLSNAQVSGLHARLHSITSTADHSSSATPGTILKADANGLPVDSIITEAGTVINIAGSLTVLNGLTLATTRVTTTPYNVLITDHTIFVDTDGAAITVNLPAGSAGKNYRIINCGSAGNAVTLAPNGAELLFGLNASDLLYDGEDENIVYQVTEGWW